MEPMRPFEQPARSSTAENILRRLEWTVIRRLDGLLHGDYRTLFRGFGVDLADLREYQYHDDVRHIDWNVSARMRTPYVRVYNEDREVTAWSLLEAAGGTSCTCCTGCSTARSSRARRAPTCATSCRRRCR